MRSVLGLAALVVGLAAPAQADEALLAAHRGAADACWASVLGQPERVEGCSDLVFEACSATPDGQSNLGMSHCLYAEADFWDEKLNAEWQRLIPLVRETDAVDAAFGPEYAVREDKLRAAQRAWIAFRDAQCAFDYAIPGGGSLRQLYYPGCLADLTRERVADLLSIGMEFGR